MIREYVLLYSPNKNADYPSIVSLANDRSRKDRLMKRRKLIALSAGFLVAFPNLVISPPTVLVQAHNHNTETQRRRSPHGPAPSHTQHPPPILSACLKS